MYICHDKLTDLRQRVDTRSLQNGKETDEQLVMPFIGLFTGKIKQKMDYSIELKAHTTRILNRLTYFQSSYVLLCVLGANTKVSSSHM